MILEKINIYLNTIQIRIFLFFCIFSLLITIIQYKSIIAFFIQLIIYYFIAEDIRCKIYGGCNLGAWINIIIPILGILIFILDYLKVFNNLKNKLKTIVDKTKIISNKLTTIVDRPNIISNKLNTIVDTPNIISNKLLVIK